jgi:hypothetical protein
MIPENGGAKFVHGSRVVASAMVEPQMPKKLHYERLQRGN